MLPKRASQRLFCAAADFSDHGAASGRTARRRHIGSAHVQKQSRRLCQRLCSLISKGEDITAARPLSPTVSQEMERSVSPGASSWGTPRRSLHPVSSRPDVLKTHHFYEGFLLLQICCFFLSGLFSRILQLFGFLLNNFDL